MSLSTLKVATEGYLKRATKAALVIAVAGYLNFSTVPPTTTTTTSYTKSRVLSGGGVGTTRYKQEQYEKIQREDEEILTFIKIFLKWQE